MRIMLDTNVLISLALFPTKHITDILEEITEYHNIVLASYVVDEFQGVIKRKFPHRSLDIDRFLSRLGFELVLTPQNMDNSLFDIRDPKDYPVLYTAIAEGVDLLITGDKDFTSMRESIKTPEILTLTEFSERYM